MIGNAFRQTGSLVALTDGGQMNPNKLQKTLEQTMEQFEAATLELRKLCERYAPGSGGFAKKPILPSMDVTGSVEAFGYGCSISRSIRCCPIAGIKAQTGSAIPFGGCWTAMRRVERNCRFLSGPC